MTQNISFIGNPCPPPMNLYPSELANSASDAPTNYLTLAPGEAINVPAQSNSYLLNLGQFLTLDYLDSVTGTWRMQQDFAINRNSMVYVTSNGSDRRITNRMGCPVSAIVAGGGSSFAQATATITANVGGSTWQAIVGGSLTVTSVTNAGANYTVPPMVMIPAPTPAGYNGSVGGVQATAYAAITNGTVSSVTMENFGAGYAFAPTVVLVPSPYDVNIGTITQATVTLGINSATTGAITAAICTNFGAPLATLSALTLTAAGGAGTGATITPQVLQTISSASVVAGGAGWGTATAPAVVMPIGGAALSVAATNLSNPQIDFSGFRPNAPTCQGVANAGGTITSVTFPNGTGLFLGTPTAALASGGTLPTTLASITFTMGTARGTAFIQPL